MYPKRNVALAEETMAYVKTNPEDWQQGTYGDTSACGTVGCFAFHAVRLSGGYTHCFDSVWRRRGIGGLVGPRLSSRDVAVQELGLSNVEAVIMFSGSNTIDALEQMVKEFSNDEEVTFH
jgi:hypothetical protein